MNKKYVILFNAMNKNGSLLFNSLKNYDKAQYTSSNSFR